MKLEPKELKLRFEFIATGKVLEAVVSANLRAAELKYLLMQEMSLSDQFLDGGVALTYLVSMSSGDRLRDDRTLEENGVRDGETFRLLFQREGG